jgi:tetratricopeptide (TPR) repeat protein
VSTAHKNFGGEAIECFEKVRNIFHELGDRHNEAMALANLGQIHTQKGNLNEAILKLEESLDVQREAGIEGSYNEGQTLFRLGTAQILQDDTLTGISL